MINHISAKGRVRANLECLQKLTLATFNESPGPKRFVLVGPNSGNTLAAGVVNHTLRRAENLMAHGFDMSFTDRPALTGRQGRVAWFTGFSGSGGSTLVNVLSLFLTHDKAPHAILDGDDLRLGLSKDLSPNKSRRA